MDFLKLASERFSVRSFSPEHLSNDEIEKILKAAHIAPTGCNFQPFRILVMNTRESLEKLKACTKCHFDAPTAMLICFNRDECWERRYDGKLSGFADACIVTTHMMLEAHSIGIGSTWVMHFDPFAMREKFNIPENIEPVALLTLGHPSADAEPNPMHSQFRPQEELVIYESF